MVYLIAGVLLGAAVMTLTLPWSRRDPEDFSVVELGYASRGSRGAAAAALRVLVEVGALHRSHRKGLRRKGNGLPQGTDPFVRAVFGGMVTPRSLDALLDLPSIAVRLPPVAARVRGAGLRVGPVRRALGSFAALAAPVVAGVGLTRGVGNTAVGVVVLVVTVAAACWLLALRGVTIAGARTVVAAPDLRAGDHEGSGGRLSHALSVGGTWLLPEFGSPDAGFGVVQSDFGGGHGSHFGGDHGGGHHGGHDGGGGDGGGY
jgi:hypothetical protein